MLYLIFSSVVFFVTSICSLIFSISWSFHCFILFPNSVSVFMTIILYSLSGKIAITISLRIFLRFFLFFHLDHIPVSSLCLTLCVGFCVLDNMATSPRLEEVTSCRRWTLSFNPDLVLGCLSILCDCLSRLLFLMAPSSWGYAKSCQCPKGEGLSQHLDSGQLEASVFLNYANIYSPVRRLT